MTLPVTNHHAPWALIRRNGDTIGERLSTRMAYLTDTVVGRDGKAVALRGYIMRNDMTGWTKQPQRIEWNAVVKRWPHQPTPRDVRAVKACRPVAIRQPTTAEARLAGEHCKAPEQNQSG